MESEDEQKAEEKQAFFWKKNSTNAKEGTEQEVAARSWVQKTRRRCKKWFLQSKFIWLFVGLVLLVITVFVVQCERSHHGEFPPEQCPSEWIGYKEKCYFISEEEKKMDI